MRITRHFKTKIIIPFVTMADIAFLLLIFLIVTSSIQKRPDLKLSLPESEQIDKIKSEGNIELFITENKIIFNKHQCNLKGLIKFLPKGKECVINADRKTDFKLIYKIIELLKKNNYEKVSFAVKRQTGIIAD